MIPQVLHCPHYRWTDIIRHGQTRQGKQRYRNLRTQIKRLVRRTMCFSKMERMHNLVIGLFINRYAFGRPL
jgi:insertion element IS1 protein InsB